MLIVFRFSFFYCRHRLLSNNIKNTRKNDLDHCSSYVTSFVLFFCHQENKTKNKKRREREIYVYKHARTTTNYELDLLSSSLSLSLFLTHS